MTMQLPSDEIHESISGGTALRLKNAWRAENQPLIDEWLRNNKPTTTNNSQINAMALPVGVKNRLQHDATFDVAGAAFWQRADVVNRTMLANRITLNQLALHSGLQHMVLRNILNGSTKRVKRELGQKIEAALQRALDAGDRVFEGATNTIDKWG